MTVCLEERKSSTHKVEVVSIKLEKHPNADSLSVVNVFGGYTCVVRSEDWAGVRQAAYVVPDSMVDVSRPEFSFLADQAKSDGRARIKARRLRGVVSFGLLVPAPEGSGIGDDVAELLDVQHYEPPIPGVSTGGGNHYLTGGETAPAPNVYSVKYDLDAFRRYHRVFVEGEQTHILEKLDGCNSRYTYLDGKIHCGSRTEWKKEYLTYSHVTEDYLLSKGCPQERVQSILDKIHSQPKKKNLWWEILEKTPALEKLCRDNPGLVVYGESFGNIATLKYHLPEGNRFSAFDIMKDGRWLDFDEAYELAGKYGLEWVPVIAKDYPYNFDGVCAMAEGETLVEGAKAGTIREGCVIRPKKERWDSHIGRVSLKCVSSLYLERYR